MSPLPLDGLLEGTRDGRVDQTHLLAFALIREHNDLHETGCAGWHGLASLAKLHCGAGNETVTSEAQHSTTFTASPPSLVSLYFVDMSAPVWRMVSTTVSSET